MRRFHLFEWEDQPWFPATLRDLMTDFLSAVFTRFPVYNVVVPLLNRLLERAQTRTIVDLASGGSGPWLALEERFRNDGAPVDVVLTDKYPNLRAFRQARKASGERIRFCWEPVDAARVPSELEGVRTLFTAFHHLDADIARTILRDASISRSPIAVFECAERSFRSVLLVPPVVLLLTLLLAPWVRPFAWQRLFWIYVVPLVPLATAWDGFVSQLRAYTPQELSELAESREGYAWEVGQLDSVFQVKVTYLVGYPRS